MSFSQNFDSFASGIRINNTIYNCTASSQPNQINPDTNAQNFQGAALGTFGISSTCARITAGEVKTFKNTNANVCTVTMFWRTYLASGAPTGAFNAVPLQTISDCNVPAFTFQDGFGPCTTGDQKWKDYSININFVNGLSVGNYVLDVYYEFTGSNTTTNGCEATKFISNFGTNFKATFTINQPLIATVSASPLVLCAGNSINLTATASNGIAPFTYLWTGPNGFSSLLQNPVILNAIPANSGSYSVVATDSCGSSSSTSSTNVVTVTPRVTPTFNAVAPICSGTAAPTLPLISNNNISGTWFPDTVSNSATGSYTFTPNASECANAVSVTVTVTPRVAPTFNANAPICSGTAAPTLPLISNNNISGTWFPATVSNATTGSYTFTPNASECANAVSVTVTVTPRVTPTFNAIAPICSGTAAPTLPLISNNNISGTWFPATVSNTATASYTFTPNASECANAVSITVTVTSRVTPTFNAIAPICSGTAAPTLPLISNNNISGTWFPATVSNTATGSYTFTPNDSECANAVSVTVTINNSPTGFNLSSTSANTGQSNGSITISNVAGGVPTFQFLLNNSQLSTVPNFQNLAAGSYVVTVRDGNGCTFSKTITVAIACSFPKGVSANNDGKNDSWDLNGCDVADVIIYNRYGTLVFEQKNYTNQWQGQTFSGFELPEATYFYVATLKSGDKKTGWVYLTR